MKTQFYALAAVLWLCAASACPAAPMNGDAVHGRDVYDARCSACHSLDANRVGPAHRGVFGRKAGTAPGYAYSPALSFSKIVWTEANLDLWLTNPQGLVPGARMGFRLSDPKERADVIAFLKANPAKR